jgi:hypothetical protein
MQRHDDRNAGSLRVSRSLIGKRTHNSTMKVRDIDALGCKHISHAAECPTGKRNIERKQRSIDAMHSNAIDHIRTTCCSDHYDLVPSPLQLSGKIVNLHLDATKARDVAIGDQSDLQWSGIESRGLIGMSHSASR